MKKYKLAILTSHPIQYQAPLFQKINNDPKIDLTVYFEGGYNLDEPAYDKEFGLDFKWDIPLLSGYNYRFLSGVLDIKRQILGNRPHALLVYGWNSINKWVAFFVAIYRDIPLFLHSENPLNQEKQKSGPKQWLKSIILSWLLGKVTACLYIGEENKKFYKHYGVPEKNLFFMPYAVDNDRFQKAYKQLRGDRKKLRKELNIDSNDIAILFVGKLIAKKNPIDLLRAYKLLIEQGATGIKKCHIVFVGSGKLKKSLQEYVERNQLKRVHFVGFKNQTELPKYYTASDIFVLPSGIGETWGLVVNEAMNFGLPILISDVPGSSFDLLKTNKNGFRFTVNNVESLAEKLEIFIKNKDKREELGKKSLEIIKSYNYQKDINGITNALEHI